VSSIVPWLSQERERERRLVEENNAKESGLSASRQGSRYILGEGPGGLATEEEFIVE